MGLLECRLPVQSGRKKGAGCVCVCVFVCVHDSNTSIVSNSEIVPERMQPYFKEEEKKKKKKKKKGIGHWPF